ncbi:hypothetical protein ABKN59_003644 [Abortiporus biennis]
MPAVECLVIVSLLPDHNIYWFSSRVLFFSYIARSLTEKFITSRLVSTSTLGTVSLRLMCCPEMRLTRGRRLGKQLFSGLLRAYRKRKSCSKPVIVVYSILKHHRRRNLTGYTCCVATLQLSIDATLDLAQTTSNPILGQNLYCNNIVILESLRHEYPDGIRFGMPETASILPFNALLPSYCLNTWSGSHLRRSYSDLPTETRVVGLQFFLPPMGPKPFLQKVALMRH